MKTSHLCFATSVLALTVAATPLSCWRGEEENCYDCGPCGFSGGPNHGPGISILDIGVDPMDAAAVELRLEKDGKCPGEDSDFFWMHYGGGGVSVEVRAAAGGLDTSTVTYAGSTYTWTDRSLTMTFERPDAARVRFTFTEAGQVTTIGCTPDATQISCAPE